MASHQCKHCQENEILAELSVSDGKPIGTINSETLPENTYRIKDVSESSENNRINVGLNALNTIRIPLTENGELDEKKLDELSPYTPTLKEKDNTDNCIGLEVDPNNTYDLATIGLVRAFVKSHNECSDAHKPLFDALWNAISTSTSSIVIKDIYNEYPYYQLNADGTVLYKGKNDELIRKSQFIPIELSRAYTTALVKEEWEASHEGGYKIGDEISNHGKIYRCIVDNTDSEFDESHWEEFHIQDEINAFKDKTRDELWKETDNKIADISYVHHMVREELADFKGSFRTWADVPTTADGYKVGSLNKSAPDKNDFIIISVATDPYLNYTTKVDKTILGETLAEDVIVDDEVILSKDRVLIQDDINLLNEKSVETVVISRTGSWRLKYTGTWDEANGEESKKLWVPEYRLSTMPFTEEQLEAINSGITEDKVTQIFTNRDNSLTRHAELSYLIANNLQAITSNTLASAKNLELIQEEANITSEKIDSQIALKVDSLHIEDKVDKKELAALHIENKVDRDELTSLHIEEKVDKNEVNSIIQSYIVEKLQNINENSTVEDLINALKS